MKKNIFISICFLFLYEIGLAKIKCNQTDSIISSSIKIIKNIEDKNQCIIALTVISTQDKKPLVGANWILTDRKKKNIISSIVYQEGKSNLVIYNISKYNHLTIAFIGYKTKELLLKAYAGKIIEISVNLDVDEKWLD